MLGDLPRKRPGTRSAKRSATPRAKPGPPPRKPSPARPQTGERPAEGDLVVDAARAVAGVARAGLQTASRVAGGVINRLPRP